MEFDSNHKHERTINSNDKFREMVAVNAYYRAEKRGFKPGHEKEDWYKAELEIQNLYRYFM